VLAQIAVLAGITLSFHYNTTAGGTIVLVAVAVYIAAVLAGKAQSRRARTERPPRQNKSLLRPPARRPAEVPVEPESDSVPVPVPDDDERGDEQDRTEVRVQHAQREQHAEISQSGITAASHRTPSPQTVVSMLPVSAPRCRRW